MEDGGSNALGEVRLKHISRNIKTFVPQKDAPSPTDDEITILTVLLHNAYQVSSRVDLTSTHRVAAWNTLCALIDQCASSSHVALHRVVWSEGLWYQLLDLYLEQAQHARPKSSKQLLATLSGAWHRAESKSKEPSIVASKLVGPLFDDRCRRRWRACLQALTHFLSKDVLLLDDVLRASTDARPISVLDDVLQDLLLVLLQNLAIGELGSATGQVISVLLDKYKSIHPNIGESAAPYQRPVWTEPLQHVASQESTNLDDLRLHIFPVLFQRSFADYCAFLRANGLEAGHSNDIADDRLLLAALQSGKALGLLEEKGKQAISFEQSAVLIPVRFVARLLRSYSSYARLTGLSLLVITHSSTRPLPASSFYSLKRYLCVLMGDTDPNFRGEVVSLMQRLLDRLRAISAFVKKHEKDAESHSPILRQCNGFLAWLHEFLITELSPSASYQHHITALKCLLVMARSGLDVHVPTYRLSKAGAIGEAKWPFHISLMHSGQRASLLGLLMDPFEDVRHTAFTVLGLYPGKEENPCCRSREGRCRELSDTINEAEDTIVTSGRADHADGIAYLYALLYNANVDAPGTSRTSRSPRQTVVAHLVNELERTLDAAARNLPSATQKYPLHGLLTSLRYVLSQPDCNYDFEDIPCRLLEALHHEWMVVRPILCNDAPEGYQAYGADEDVATNSKDTLSYCWRSLKESSLLIGTLTYHSTLSQQQILSLSSLSFTQLAELRHRGAFSTVAQTWASCCLRCRDMTSEDGNNMLDIWYKQTLAILDGSVLINTRRSAGLPSLFCGLLIADPSDLLLSIAFKDLSQIALRPVNTAENQQSSLPQVHALNCIKDILKNSRLGEKSEHYIPQSLRLAADSLRSGAWAVRNCGLMLFRAVIDRLLGTSEAHLDDDRASDAHISTDQHPQLLEVVLDLLKSSDVIAGSGGGEAVFPALQLLHYMDIPSQRQIEVEEAVFRLTANASWHIRDKAARVYAVISQAEALHTRIKEVLRAAPLLHNALHGALLCLKYLAIRLNQLSNTRRPATEVQTSQHTHDDRARLLTVLFDKARSAIENTRCSIITATWVDATTELCRLLALVNLDEGPSLGKLSLPMIGTFFADNMGTMAHKKLTSAEQDVPGDALLRQKLAVAVGNHLCGRAVPNENGSARLRSLLLRFIVVDPDACSTLYGEIPRSMIHKEKGLHVTAVGKLMDVWEDVLSNHLNPNLICEAQRFALWLHAHGILSSSITPLRLWRSLVVGKPEAVSTANGQYADQWLQLCGAALDLRLSSASEGSSAIDPDVREWADSCIMAISLDPDSLFSSEAAAKALDRPHHFWTHVASMDATTFQGLCLGVYDLLNDDDENVRLLAARVTSRVVATAQPAGRVEVLEPTEARNCLLRFMLRRWRTSVSFAQTALIRAFGSFVIDGSADGFSVGQKFDSAASVDPALFAEEKQNLYIDPAKEAKVWKDVVLRLEPSVLPQESLDQTARFAYFGLDELSRRVGETKGSSTGWARSPEVFTLGLQIVYGADVVMHAVSRDRRLFSAPSQIRSKIVACAAAMEAAPANAIWERELSRVVGVTSRDVVKSRAELVRTMEERLLG